MFTALIVLQIIISALLVISILMQSSKGGGLAGTFGGGQVGTMFGVRRTADFLIRATQVLAALFMVLSLATNILFLPRSATAESILQKGASVMTQQPASTTPQLPPAEAPVQQPGQ